MDRRNWKLKKPALDIRTLAVCAAACAIIMLCATPLALIEKQEADAIEQEPQPIAVQSEQEVPEPIYEEPVPPPAPIKLDLALVGDLMCHQSNLDAAYDKQTQAYDFAPFFESIKPYIEGADLAIGNLETTFAGEGAPYRGYPRFNSPTQYLDALQAVGFDVLTNANNHANDFGLAGIQSTQAELAKRGISHTGAGQTRPVIIESRGVKLGMIAYTAISNSKPEEGALNYLYKDGGLNSQIALDIAELRQQGAQFILMNVHWGNEYSTAPSAAMKSDAQALADMGADAVIGHHPHVVQPIEVLDAWREGEAVKVPVMYSLGNFFCNPSKNSQTAEGMIAHLTLVSEGGKTSFESVSYTPTYTHRDTKSRVYDVLPALPQQSEALSMDVDAKLAKRMDKAWQNTTEIAGEYLLGEMADVNIG